ncbi:MAG: VCBS repeat-containing protein [Bryobacterales bacterium]|nr:VCBS repeat-containing protein [Bryobacterales bacterium]
MANVLDSLWKISANVAEAGLLAMDATLKTAQSSLGSLVGQSAPAAPTSPPLTGPRDIDSAVSEFANRMARILRYSILDRKDYTGAAEEVIASARHCFSFIDFSDPKNAMVPAQLPLSFATLMTQQGLRALASFDVVGAERYPRFVVDVAEMFTEIQYFVSVQYPQLVQRYKERLQAVPGDTRARIELARIQIKCGLYDEAIANLQIAAKDPGFYAWAMHEMAVAQFRGGRYADALRSADAALAAKPDNQRIRLWLWHCAQKAGGYPDTVPPERRMTVKAGYAKPSVVFEDIAAKVGLDKTSAGRGLAVFDYNNDGHLDVLISAAHAGCSLFRNNGDGTFTDVSIGSGIDNCVNGFVVAVGDYNNDGFQDVYITRLGFYLGEGELWRNNGDGTFTNVTEQAGLKCWGPHFVATWADYDNDGFLDLFITNNLGGMFDRKTHNLLFHNNGDGTFTEVSEKAGLKTIWPTIGACWGDYNNDGLPDLFLSNAMGRSQLYRNNGDGTFTDVSEEAGIDGFSIGSTSFWFDFNNDGWLDIVQFQWSDHEDMAYTMEHGEGPPDGRPAKLYRNNGDGTFTDVGREVGLNGCWGTMSGNAGDFNNDGWLDLVFGNGSPRMDRVEPPILHEFDGQRFRNVSFAAGMPFTGKGHGGNFADLMGDGRLCMLMASGGAYPGDLLTTGVFQPKELPGNYINIRLTGTKSNRDAIGARLCLEAGGRKQYREIGGGTNFGCLPFEQHFGLGNIANIEALEIRWPSGLRQRLESLPVNKTIRIVEGSQHWEGVYKHEWTQVAAD